MSTKKRPQPAKPQPRMIDLDALVGNAPPIKLAGREFEGREFTIRERIRWIDVEQGLDAKEQLGVLRDLLAARAKDSEPVTEEWVQENVTARQASKLVEALFGMVADARGNA